MLWDIDEATYYLQYHNKNLTQKQDYYINMLCEYIDKLEELIDDNRLDYNVYKVFVYSEKNILQWVNSYFDKIEAKKNAKSILKNHKNWSVEIIHRGEQVSYE